MASPGYAPSQEQIAWRVQANGQSGTQEILSVRLSNIKPVYVALLMAALLAAAACTSAPTTTSTTPPTATTTATTPPLTTTQTTAPPTTTTVPTFSEVSGAIKSFSGVTITITTASGDITLEMATGTTIIRPDGTTGNSSDLQPGKMVTVRYDPNTRNAQQITITQ